MPTKTVNPTSVRLSPKNKLLVSEIAASLNISQSSLMGMAVERCLADKRWSSCLNSTGASEREKALFQTFVGLSQVVNQLAFAVDESLEAKNRNRRLEAKRLVNDAYVELEKIRSDLNVCQNY